jgi:hypothetical protein
VRISQQGCYSNTKQSDLISMFTLYCDDSGTHPKSDIAVAACYISTVEQWTEFKRNWDEANARYNFGVFHLADFVSRHEQFAAPEWADKVNRDRTIQALINLIKTRALIGFSAVVVKSAFDEVIVGNKSLQEKYGDNHYAFVVRLCTSLVDRWRQKHKYDASIQYIFDRLSKGKGEINTLFEMLLKGGDDAMRRYGVHKDCWSFQDKAQVTQLQAADIWAWENYRYMRTNVLAVLDGPKAPIRRSYLALRESPVQVRYHTLESLQELSRRVDMADDVSKAAIY